jgi:hypothetical protein
VSTWTLSWSRRHSGLTKAGDTCSNAIPAMTASSRWAPPVVTRHVEPRCNASSGVRHPGPRLCPAFADRSVSVTRLLARAVHVGSRSVAVFTHRRWNIGGRG